jgi:hypothetical protein
MPLLSISLTARRSRRTAAGVCLLAACTLPAGAQTAPQIGAKPASVRDPADKHSEEADFAYTVKAGDNPWSLTERYLLGLSYWPRLVAYNRIADDRRIPPGTVLRIPLAWLKFTGTSMRLAGVSGTVEMETGKGWIPAISGTPLQQGHRLRTRNGGALLILTDGSLIRMRADSELVITSLGRLAANGALWLSVDLLKGHLESEAHELKASGGRFDLRTPAAITSVRGTVFRVSTDGEQARTEVVEGLVGVRNSHGEVRVPGANGTLVHRGQAPLAPRGLLAAPPLPASVGSTSGRPLDLGRPVLEAAAAFRTQVFAAPPEGHGALLHEMVAEAVAVPALPEGRYVLQVRGIDAAGLEGLSSRSQVQVQAPPAIPLLAPTPAPAGEPAGEPALVPPPLWATVKVAHELQLAWVALDTARLYQVQVLLDHARAPVIVLDDYVVATVLTLPVPPPGQYRVRVRMAPELGREPAWSEERRIDGRRPPARGFGNWWSGPQ